MHNEFIPILTDRIVREFDPLQVILFGSHAREDADQHSDIDLLVVFDELPDKRKSAIDIMNALSDIPVAKDIIVSTPEELERDRTRIGSVLRYAQQEGKVLWKSWNATPFESSQVSNLSVKEENTDIHTTHRLEDTTRWLRYAEEDLTTAETFLGHPHVPPRQSCWLAQQAVEKALKAALIFLQIDFRRTHDLVELRDMFPESWQLKKTHPNLSNLTKWVVEARYPEKIQDATEAEASEAVKQARSVWESVSDALAKHGVQIEKTYKS